MGVGIQIEKAETPALLLAMTLFAAFSFLAQAQRPALPQRLPFSASEQQAYLDSLIRSAPNTWQHGKNWVIINPYVFGRSVSLPSVRTVCPDLGHENPFDVGVDFPSWIYAASESCDEFSNSRDSALLVLADPKDNDAGYFLFLICDVKGSRRHCDIQPSSGEYGMKLEESNKGENRQFDVLAETVDNKTARYHVAEVWHMRKSAPQPSDK